MECLIGRIVFNKGINVSILALLFEYYFENIELFYYLTINEKKVIYRIRKIVYD